jgi:hypothetical protein
MRAQSTLSFRVFVRLGLVCWAVVLFVVAPVVLPCCCGRVPRLGFFLLLVSWGWCACGLLSLLLAFCVGACVCLARGCVRVCVCGLVLVSVGFCSLLE